MISVVIATYNGERYIKEQLTSIFKQHCRPDEIVVCDDNSSDRTVDICETELKKEKIKYRIIEHKKNQGVCKTFFEGIRLAQGDIVFLCDQDDYWLPDKIDVMVSYLMTEYELVMSNAIIVDEKLKRYGTLWDAIDFVPKENNCDQINEMLKRNYFTGMNMCFSKKIIPMNIDVKFMLHDEFIGWCGLLKGKVKFVNKELAMYRQHSGNVVGVNKHSKFVSLSKTIDKIILNIKKEIKKIIFIRKAFGINRNEYKEFKEAIRFQCWRLKNIYNFNCLSLLRIVYKGYYGKFTSDTEYALLKDLICKFEHIRRWLKC